MIFVSHEGKWDWWVQKSRKKAYRGLELAELLSPAELSGDFGDFTPS